MKTIFLHIYITNYGLNYSEIPVENMVIKYTNKSKSYKIRISNCRPHNLSDTLILTIIICKMD